MPAAGCAAAQPTVDIHAAALKAAHAKFDPPPTPVPGDRYAHVRDAECPAPTERETGAAAVCDVTFLDDLDPVPIAIRVVDARAGRTETAVLVGTSFECASISTPWVANLMRDNDRCH